MSGKGSGMSGRFWPASIKLYDDRHAKSDISSDHRAKLNAMLDDATLVERAKRKPKPKRKPKRRRERSKA
jgi:hypothetical protein